MIALKPANDRGRTDLGWLQSSHSFSFGDYFDPRNMGFSVLRVINDDWVAPGQGFGTHPHRDMEILTYVLEGALEHKDSMGNGSVIRPGDVQRMTAGTGITHSEFNPSATEPVRLLQIWIRPEKPGLTPSYEQKTFTADDKRGRLRLIASHDGREGSVRFRQNADLFASVLTAGEKVRHSLAPNRNAWVQVATGNVTVNGKPLTAGDGAAVRDERELAFVADSDTEFLLFDLP